MNILILVSHPFELWFNSFIYKLLKTQELNVSILLVKSENSKIDYKTLFVKLYSKNLNFLQIIIPEESKSLKKLFPNYQTTKLIRRQITNFINVQEYILICHDKSKFSSRVIMSMFSKIILIQPGTNKNFEQYRFVFSETIRDFFLSIVYRTAPNLIYKLNSTNNIRHVILLSSKPFIIYRSGLWNETNSIRIRDHREISLPPRKILLLGFRHYSWDWVTSDLREKMINECINEIEKYPSSSILYIPHPRESDREFNDLKKKLNSPIALLDGTWPAEIVFTLDLEIDLCIGFGSTALSSARSVGLPTVAIYDRFDIPNEIENVFREIVEIDLVLDKCNNPLSSIMLAINSFTLKS